MVMQPVWQVLPQVIKDQGAAKATLTPRQPRSWALFTKLKGWGRS